MIIFLNRILIGKMDNTTEYFPSNTTLTTTLATTLTTTLEPEMNISSYVFIILFGGFLGSISLILTCSFFISCITDSDPRIPNRSYYSITSSIICLIIMDCIGLFCCNLPLMNSYHNERGTGKCDQYNCDCSRCHCCKCKKNSQPKVETVDLFEIVVTQPSDKKETCVICCEELGKGKHGELKCGHKFHKKCIKHWMEVSAHKDCPTCRESQANFH